MKEVVPEIIQEKRRIKKNGKYPVKIRIIYNREAKYYPVGVDLTTEDFELVCSHKKSPNRLASEYSIIFKEHGKIIDIISTLGTFSFHGFEKRYQSKSYGTNSVKAYFSVQIKYLRDNDRIGTADAYTNSITSLLKFQEMVNRKKDILFSEITPQWLMDYERYVVKNGYSYTTVGIYLRALRAIFNLAIENEEIPREHYPFGKRRYQIPATVKRKKALSNDELIKVASGKAKNVFQERARDFWLLSFYCNGMNIFDIARLKWTDIENDKLYFIRNKTKHTTRTNQSEIVVHINSFVKQIIDKYGNTKSPYIFDIIDDGMSETKIKLAVKTFTRFVNQHIKLLAKEVGITDQISTIWARHSYTTSVIRLGGSMEFVQESLGHQNMKTTMNYWAGFDQDSKKSMSENLLNIIDGR